MTGTSKCPVIVEEVDPSVVHIDLPEQPNDTTNSHLSGFSLMNLLLLFLWDVYGESDRQTHFPCLFPVSGCYKVDFQEVSVVAEPHSGPELMYLYVFLPAGTGADPRGRRFKWPRINDLD